MLIRSLQRYRDTPPLLTKAKTDDPRRAKADKKGTLDMNAVVHAESSVDHRETLHREPPLQIAKS